MQVANFELAVLEYEQCGEVRSMAELTNSNNEAAQRAELHRKIWAIADDVRGAVDGLDFK